MRHSTLKCAIPCVTILASVIAVRGDDKNGANVYLQHNLVSDVMSVAARVDQQLVNAWGIDHSPTGPWWVNSADKGLSIVYDANGNPAPAMNHIVVTIPGSGPNPAEPTGIVFNPTMDFQLALTRPALFLFATTGGTIAGWNSQVDPTIAVVKVTK